MMPGMIIRLEIDEMKYQVMHHLGSHHKEIEDAVKEHLDAALKGLDFQKMLREAAQHALYEAIREALKRAVTDAFYDHTVKDNLKSAAIITIANAIKGE